MNPSRRNRIRRSRCSVPYRVFLHPIEVMPQRTEATITKTTEPYLEVGLICADRDGNRIRIDRVDRDAGTLSYHFLNDELRVQEGIQERSIEQFLAEGWYMAATGRSL
jgi:hypothetical protein